MEAIDRGDAPALLLKRFPPGMVRRLMKLQEISEDPCDKFFIQAQILVRQILLAPKSRYSDGDEAQKAPEILEVRTGRIEVPMPGAPGDVDDQPSEPLPDAKAG
jgi:hypothetical protein